MNASMKCILLVDDNENDVKLITNELRNANLGNEIVVAEDGEEALDFLYHRGRFANSTYDLPLLIFLDIKMPLMDGIDLLKVIRSKPQFNIIPVIMLTSSRDLHDLKECYDNGANSYVVKPVNITDFMRVVKELGQYWLLVNERPS